MILKIKSFEGSLKPLQTLVEQPKAPRCHELTTGGPGDNLS